MCALNDFFGSSACHFAAEDYFPLANADDVGAYGVSDLHGKLTVLADQFVAAIAPSLLAPISTNTHSDPMDTTVPWISLSLGTTESVSFWLASNRAAKSSDCPGESSKSVSAELSGVRVGISIPFSSIVDIFVNSFPRELQDDSRRR